jgi:hypothetical protein
MTPLEIKNRMVTFTVQMNDSQAEALAQFLKRVGFQELRQNAVDDVEAYTMRDAVDHVRDALREAGFAPR